MWQGEMKRETDWTLTLKVPGCIYLGKWLRISVLNYEMEILINNLKWLAGTAITHSFGQHSRHVCESFCHCDKHPRKSLMEEGFILAYDFRVSAHGWPHCCCGFWWGRMWWWEVCGRTELLTSLHPGSKERMTVLWPSPLLFCLTLACWLLQPREGQVSTLSDFSWRLKWTQELHSNWTLRCNSWSAAMLSSFLPPFPCPMGNVRYTFLGPAVAHWGWK